MKHRFSLYWAHLYTIHTARNEATEKLLQQLDRQSALFEETMRNGYGSEDHLAQIRIVLEQLAQRLDKDSTKVRRLLNTYWSTLPSQVSAHPYSGGDNLPYPELDMQYDEDRGLFTITIPGMLPFRMAKGANYLHDQIVANVRSFVKAWYQAYGRQIYIAPAVVIFIHCMERGHTINIKDYDNLERKRVLDGLQVTSLFSDNPTRMIDINMMAWADETCTIIHIAKLEQLYSLLGSLDFSAYLERDVRAPEQHRRDTNSIPQSIPE